MGDESHEYLIHLKEAITMWFLWQERTHCFRLQKQEKLAAHARIDVWEPTLEGDPLPPRRRVLSPIQKQQVIEQVNQWLDKDTIEPIPNPPLTNNLVLVAKKDGRVRVCIDCTPANRVTTGFDWPLPRLQDMRYRVAGATWFSRIDLQDAFFRIRIPIKHRHLTAFSTGEQTYQFKRMPFGLKTAPAVFQRFMDWGLSDYDQEAFWYMDDILIHANSRRELIAREKRIRERLRHMQCTVNEPKSLSLQQTILFAGLEVSGKGVGGNSQKLTELLAIPPPRNKAEAQSALGLVSYLRDFIPLVSHFTAMLYPDKNGLKLPEHEYEAQWELLRSHLASATTITHHWKEGVDADLYTDASQYAVGVVVIQQERITALASRKLSPAETRYSATDREHLGLVFAAEKLRMILHQSNATTRVYSDHAALLTRQPDKLTPRQARWNTLVNHWMPKIAHVRGKLNPADFVSRWRIEGVGAKFST